MKFASLSLYKYIYPTFQMISTKKGIIFLILLSGFTVGKWLSDRGIPSTLPLPSYVLINLLNDVGLTTYLSESSCTDMTTYSGK